MNKLSGQSVRVLNYMEQGNRIDPLKSWTEIGVYRLASRVCDINKIIPVQRGWVKVKNRFGEVVRVREYWI